MLDEVGLAAHRLGVHGVVRGPNHQRRRGDLWEPRCDVPVDDSATHLELAWPLHQIVELVVESRERPGHVFRPGVQAAHVLAVKLRIHQLEVGRVVIRPGRFVSLQRVHKRRAHGRTQHLLVVCRVVWDGRLHVAHHQTLQVLRVGQRIFHRQHASPAVAEQVKVGRVHAQRLPNLVHFLDPTGNVPQVLFRLVAEEAAELVVHVHFRRRTSKASMGWKLVREVEHVLVGARGATMQDQDFGVVAGTKLLGEHLISIAELNHGHAILSVFGGAQGKVLFRERHGAISSDVVVLGRIWSGDGSWCAAAQGGQTPGRSQHVKGGFHALKMGPTPRTLELLDVYSSRGTHETANESGPPRWSGVGRMAGGGHRPRHPNGVGGPDALRGD